MIACPRCGWFADVPRDREKAVWAEHQRDPFCADVEPVHAPPASPHRARLCIKGHRRDAFGICWKCLSEKAKIPLRARARHRGRTTWVWDAEVLNDEGKLCALAQMGIAVRPVPDQA